MEHHGMLCLTCRKPTDVIAGWVHVDEVSLEVDSRRHNCPHCGATCVIALKSVELLGDEQVPNIELNLVA
jgi:hypothetical protein